MALLWESLTLIFRHLSKRLSKLNYDYVRW